jgi:methionyl-tRNA formyltransferase
MVNPYPRIVYMGTPGFAIPPLERLLESGYNVVGVITAPDRRAGRGKKLRHSAVKEYLLKLDSPVPLLQPENLKEPSFLKELGDLKPDLQVVVAFRMLPEAVWSIPELGTFNLHASLLPQYRGAAPINHVIMNGESETGVTTFFIDEQIDTGRIILQEKTAVGADETAGQLHDRLMQLGAGLVLETVERITEGRVETQSQDQFMDSMEVLKKAPKIFKEDCRIDWNLPGKAIYNLIRGLSPYPGAFTMLEREGKEPLICKIFKATFESLPHKHPPGTIYTDGKQSLKVAVNGGMLYIHSVQQEGKRKMDIKDFLAGFSITNGVSRFS